MTLPVSDPWYHATQLSERLWLITEPRVHPIFSANMHLVLGRDGDLLIDSGMGVAPLRPFVDTLRPERDKPLTLLSTHTHVDHIGAAHEFDIRLVHPLEAEALRRPEPYSLNAEEIPERLRRLFLDAGYPPLWPLLVDAVPWKAYDVAAYELKGAEPTRMVEDGDVVDLGDWHAEVLHLPGHSPGQVGLWEAETGTLFGADAIYDGPLIYDGAGMSVADYAATLRRIASLPVTSVHGGHDPSFGKERMDEIVRRYLEIWEGEGATV
ncbi:MBL fold metallo-hydrolase [Algicella marina]|uniref:MBL fold metallo-hydrolase n=1 Tax=Algicella marina TaxID=2683284 RepID=A0A6P1T5B1_9RHOB|nr:MBL fold metallo-hydrolase [Algicella marina]QHQ36935.1 MBL fold metallo-hydrolase [Algicella marina]